VSFKGLTVVTLMVSGGESGAEGCQSPTDEGEVSAAAERPGSED